MAQFAGQNVYRILTQLPELKQGKFGDALIQAYLKADTELLART